MRGRHGFHKDKRSDGLLKKSHLIRESDCPAERSKYRTVQKPKKCSERSIGNVKYIDRGGALKENANRFSPLDQDVIAD